MIYPNLNPPILGLLVLSCWTKYFRDPEPVQLDEMDEADEAVQGHPLNESFKFRDPEQLNGIQGSCSDIHWTGTVYWRIPYWEELHIKYIKTRQRIATIEEQLIAYNLLWFVLLPLDFFKPHTRLAGVFGGAKYTPGPYRWTED